MTTTTDAETAEWRRRLIEAVAASGRSMRSISLAAGCGPGYLHSICHEEKSPNVENLLGVCRVLGVSTPYILHGIDISEDEVELLEELRRRKDILPALMRLLEATR